ncbi:MAG: NADH-quinone oxidoreductase subunit C [Ignavibacteriae bacterium HGW-Ignavibacteriae-3]|nr:MAG: NADH-quinone oxidoreductase subunit C [Ignavibacteriae bacterium HGW-Ignavibacteriae-3]
MNPKEFITEKVKEKFGPALEEVSDFRDDLCLTIKSDRIVLLGNFLKTDPDLQFLMCKDVTAIDWSTRKKRFTIVYHVHSFKLNFTLRIKANIELDPPSIETVTSVWRSAEWYERETWDMYGIKFINHPDLRRMYMPEGFEHHPLRKDFPVIGIPGSLPLPHKAE